MTIKQRLELEQSELRQRINELLSVEELTDEQRTEMATLTTRAQEIEVEIRAAIVAGDEVVIPPAGESPEDRELRRLIGSASAGSIFSATLEHRNTEGPERELQDHYGLGPNQIPLSMLEERAVTPAPANVGAEQAVIIPGVFPQSCAAFLGVDMPTVGVGEAVFPVLATNATVGVPAEGVAQAETTGSFTAEALVPARLQASFFYSREDRARFAGMDQALRQNLSMALADALDREVISGANGLLTGVNLPNHNVAAITDFALYLSGLAYGRIDGTYAAMTPDLRIVMGAGTYAHAGSVYRNNSVDRNALDRLMEITSGVKVSAHVPAVSSAHKQNAVIARGMGLRHMTAPIWEGVTLIPDEVTLADKGEIKVTAVMLHAVQILRADGFFKQQTQHA